jgi:hypothetical protein
MPVPPGLLYAYDRLGSVLIPPVCVYNLHRLVFNFAPRLLPNWTSQYDLNTLLPVWLWIILGLLSWPIWWWYSDKSRQWENEAECKKLGAKLPPLAVDESGLPLGIGFMGKAMRYYKKRYIGALLLSSGHFMSDPC